MVLVQRAARKFRRFLFLMYRSVGATFFSNCCRFHPSCSVYAEIAWERFGFIKGAWLTIRRVIQCHPFCLGGVDLVPDQ